MEGNVADNALSDRDPAMSPDHAFPSGHRGSFSVSEWCRYRGICPATFYNHLQRGEMPATLKIGRRTIITAEADAEWRLRMERQAATPPPDNGRATRGHLTDFRTKSPDRRAVQA
jgi:hypothetical protein